MLFYYVKIFHIISFVSWMAMLFYLPRLFVYHAEHLDNMGFVEVVKIQEEKLYNFIGYPALIATFASGVWLLVLEPSFLTGGGWMHAKILLVVLLLAYHFSLYRYMVAFRENRCFKSGKFFRAYNEVPTIVLIFITILVILKPF
ncbi:protoporphyrinogen oxidase HemJ [Helicobacter winghamensis]|uniref:Protoporphyrinogen IX oxidase n=1 Tax=Helicobacter winghamensis TaxID=157268 RepID=A0A2N3PK59_9HELI|nr:protoporphyrinogen oxidase HemJ [Helicobacter winghamensis]EEO25865.1 TIGR00701 family protein [Helicobacter winghamensis ATCC BAA-430]PKT76906.1 TIGR00701 family protein [Helicobacter winghamensis]PKT77046.1 TIGR00701 family protein [Helicobacter winghamensis]PKT77569.1 TIGR00701 family protein [Helicobacter winghamensis]PKT81808.1 TIGR00701 family protein [Helicobacter winghamensis]